MDPGAPRCGTIESVAVSHLKRMSLGQLLFDLEVTLEVTDLVGALESTPKTRRILWDLEGLSRDLESELAGREEWAELLAPWAGRG